MAARAYWQGQIRLALVSIPVQVFPATKSAARIAFNQIHKPSGKRIRYEKVVPGLGAVDADDIVKSYEVEKGKYVLLTDDEISDVKLEAKHTIDLVQFVDADEIDTVYFDKPYFVSPDEDEVAGEAYVVLRDALKATKKIGLGQLVARGQASIVALRAAGKGLVIETVRYADELQNSEQFFTTIPAAKPEKELLSLATELIERKVKPFDIAPGTKCELICPVSNQPLDFVGEVEDNSGAKYFAIYLTPQLSRGTMVMISDVWGHYHSRIVDDFELISAWAAAHTD